MPVTAARSTMHPLGTLLVRVIVPLWVLAGAAFKLYERNPGNLPSVILVNLKDHIDAMLLLRILIGLELFAVGVMLFVPRFARAMAIFMLSCFCLILIGEMIRGATKCGCFGSLPFKPWHMLIIDGSLLLAVLIFSWPWRDKTVATPPAQAVKVPERSPSYGLPIAASAVLAIVGMSVAFAVPTQKAKDQIALNPGAAGGSGNGATATQPNGSPPTTQSSGQSSGEPGGAQSQPSPPDIAPTPTPPVATNLPPTVNPAPKALPATWYTSDMDQWVGKPWRELELFQLMPAWPKDMDAGKRFVVFYSRTCEHCQTMFEEDLILPQSGPVTVVEIPQSRSEMTGEGAWAMPPGLSDLEFLQLPLGVNWLIQPPLVIALENGKVTCAKEGEHKTCMGIP